MKEKKCYLLVCRIENLHRLIKYYRIQGKNYLANVFFKIADEERKKSINQVILGKSKRNSVRCVFKALIFISNLSYLREYLFNLPNIT